MSTTFKTGDRVVIFNPLYPDAPSEEHVVGRVTCRTLRLKGESSASARWTPEGRHQRGAWKNSLRLLRPEDLSTAQEEARRENDELLALHNARYDTLRLAIQIASVSHDCTTAAEVRAKVTETLRAALAEWST